MINVAIRFVKGGSWLLFCCIIILLMSLHPPCTLPHDQFGHPFCERWALVIVLFHHHIDELA
jgi:hypothetical protein